MLKPIADDQELLTVLKESQRLLNAVVVTINLINQVSTQDLSTTLVIETTFYSPTQDLHEQPLLLLHFESISAYSFGYNFTFNSIKSCKFFQIDQEYYFSFSPQSDLSKIEEGDTNFIKAGSVKGYTFIVL